MVFLYHGANRIVLKLTIKEVRSYLCAFQEMKTITLAKRECALQGSGTVCSGNV